MLSQMYLYIIVVALEYAIYASNHWTITGVTVGQPICVWHQVSCFVNDSFLFTM